jgi:hypothetical protein
MSYQNRSVSFSAQRCVNLFASPAEGAALDGFALFGTPGIVEKIDLGAAPSRGAAFMDGRYWVVTGDTLWSLGIDPVTGQLLAINMSDLTGVDIEGSGRVAMASNAGPNKQLCIVVPGGKGYVAFWNESTVGLQEITDPDYLPSDSVCYKDGYYIFTETDSNVILLSGENDPLSFNALEFGTAEQRPGDIVSCVVMGNQLYILKEESTEVYQNVGEGDFPFQAAKSAGSDKGAHSRHSPIVFEGGYYFIGGGVNEDTAIWRAGKSGVPQKISTDAIDNEIGKFTEDEILEAFSFTYSLAGATFIGFTFRSDVRASRTFVFNVEASNASGKMVWFEQQSGMDDDAWRIASATEAFGVVLVSDSKDGRIGFLDLETYTEYGEPIERMKVTPPLVRGGNPFFVWAIELFMQSGVGLITGQGSDPQVMMDFSIDNARNWSNPEQVAPIGKIGEYLRRTVWRKLGRAPYNMVFRFRVTDPVPVVMMKLVGEVEDGY